VSSDLRELHQQPHQACAQPRHPPPPAARPSPAMETAPPPDIAVPSIETTADKTDDAATKPALTPPTSEDLDKRDEQMSSELSDLESDDDEEIEPDHYWDGGKIPVFKPVRLYLAEECAGRESCAADQNACDTEMVLTVACADNGPVS
jgi:hypothetical protein